MRIRITLDIDRTAPGDGPRVPIPPVPAWRGLTVTPNGAPPSKIQDAPPPRRRPTAPDAHAAAWRHTPPDTGPLTANEVSAILFAFVGFWLCIGAILFGVFILNNRDKLDDHPDAPHAIVLDPVPAPAHP